MKNVLIGKIVNFHGIKGEIKVISDSDFKEIRFKKGSTIIIDNKNYEIASYRVHKNFDLITLKGFSNINDVLFLKNKEIFCEYVEIDLDEDEYHYSDLEGMEVINEEGTLVGKVSTVERLPACDYIRVIKNDNTSSLIPFKKEFILNIDDKITICSMEGLL